MPDRREEALALLQRLQEKGYSQNRVARFLNLHPYTLSRWRTSGLTPSEPVVERLRRVVERIHGPSLAASIDEAVDVAHTLLAAWRAAYHRGDRLAMLDAELDFMVLSDYITETLNAEGGAVSPPSEETD